MDLKTITATLALLGLGACGGEAKKDAKPADAKPADAKPADAKPADAKPVDTKPADDKAGEMACGEGKCGAGKCGATKPDDKAVPVDSAAGAGTAEAKPEDGKKT
ncbi:MAG TPA: hypothetical protein VIK91_24685 [Nannocystis sp.]